MLWGDGRGLDCGMGAGLWGDLPRGQEETPGGNPWRQSLAVTPATGAQRGYLSRFYD